MIPRAIRDFSGSGRSHGKSRHEQAVNHADASHCGDFLQFHGFREAQEPSVSYLVVPKVRVHISLFFVLLESDGKVTAVLERFRRLSSIKAWL